MGEVFQRLQAQQEARAREQEAREQAAGVRPVMLRRLSTHAATPNRADASESRREREEVREGEAIDRVDRGPVGREQDTRENGPVLLHDNPEPHYPPPAVRAIHSPAADEIDRQFSSVFTPPTSPSGPTSLQQPRVRRVVREDKLAGEGHHHRRIQPQQHLEEEEEEEEALVELMPPLQASHGYHHDGNVQLQQLEDTSGVKVPDRRDILVPKRDHRPSLLQNGHSLFSPPPPAKRSSSPVPPPPSTHAQHCSTGPTPTQSPPHTSVVRSPSDLLAMKVSLS